METETLTRIAYRAYGDWMAWKTAQDKPLPAWDELPMSLQNAWTAAISAVSTEIVRASAMPVEAAHLP